jgi:hypothetical protein
MPTSQSIPYKKWILWTLGLGVGLGLIALLAAWGLPIYFRNELDNALKKAVVNASDSLYRINYESIYLNIPLGNAEVSKVKLTSDSTVYQQLVAGKKAPNNLIELVADKVSLSGVSLLRLLIFKELAINTILIDKPVAHIAHDPMPYNKGGPSKSPYELINKVLKSIRIDKISLNNVDFTYVNYSDSLQRPQKSSLKKLYLDVSDFLLDENSEKDSSRILYSQNIALRAEGLELPSGNSLYIFRMAELRFSTRDSTLQVKNVHYQPLLPKLEFSKKLGWAADRLDLEFNDIKATQVDTKRFLVDRQLFAKNLYIDAGLMDIFKDKRYRVIAKEKMGEYPHQLLLKSKFRIGFDKVHLKSTRVKYGEMNEKTNRSGAVFFDGTHGTITNLTNDSEWIRKNPNCRVDVQTRFMSQGALHAYFDFDLAAKNGAFRCGGKMKNFEMPRLNEVTEALAKASVTSGKVSMLDFDIQATNTRAVINTRLHYDDLKVDVLKVDKKTGELKRRWFLSQVANNVVLNENNPRGDRPARIGKAVIEREDDESFFNLIWHSLFVSIKHITIGRGD